MQAHATAVATALSKCSCTSAKAAGFGKASTYITLVAQACSAVTVSVCVLGKQAASAEAFQMCLGVSTAHLFAKARVRAARALSCCPPHA